MVLERQNAFGQQIFYFIFKDPKYSGLQGL